ncbi:rhodanese-like domain-containing protein [candidate division KSB1 bacterium]|nr:rhodanese-like domain-containing protein [candidate division KSB1 bacterium]
MKLEGKQIGIVISLVLGLILAFLPVQSRQITINPDELAQSILNTEDRIDPQTVSQWLVEGNGDFSLIDVRSAEEFQQGHIKGAVNIPLIDLVKLATIEELDTDKTIILYSNGISHASQAWVVLHSAGVQDIVVLGGGLNYWNKVVLNPQEPNPYASNDEILVYKAKAAIASALGGGGFEMQENHSASVKLKPVIRKNRKKKKADGGC